MSELELPDVNVLVALMHAAHLHHPQAREWFASVERFATTPVTESGFVRVSLNPLVVGPQVSAGAALTSLRSLRQHERSVFLPDDSSLAEASIDLHGLAGTKQVTDFHLVNLAASHSARFVTFDQKVVGTLTTNAASVVRTLG